MSTSPITLTNPQMKIIFFGIKLIILENRQVDDEADVHVLPVSPSFEKLVCILSRPTVGELPLRRARIDDLIGE